MNRVIIFGGTVEGRILAEYCSQNRIKAILSVASDYGTWLLPESQYLKVVSGRMDKLQMEELFRKEETCLVIDATHPYAVEVSKNIVSAARKEDLTYLRVIRSGNCKGVKLLEMERFQTLEQAVDYLSHTTGNILVTTGSKELKLFTQMPQYKERVYARVLPFSQVVSACEEIGICASHLICMQGPFSRELNSAMMKQFQIRYLVTKEAGSAGGFEEKAEAATDCKAVLCVIGRPSEETGVTIEAAKQVLDQYQELEMLEISLVGIGMGGKRQMTLEALDCLKNSDVVFGAQRLLDSVSTEMDHKLLVPVYLKQEILSWLQSNPRYRKAAVVYSGDTGFYSGAKQMFESAVSVKVYPGISSVSYFCAKLKKGWEDVYLFSLHGRDGDLVSKVKQYPRVFVLLGGGNTVNKVCRQLTEAGQHQVKIYVGERLSYPEERICSGTLEELEGKEFQDLCAVLIERGETGEG